MDIVIISPRVDELVDYNETRFSIDQNLVNFVNLLNKEDLPTLGRPIIAIEVNIFFNHLIY